MHPNAKDETGNRYGRLTVMRPAGRSRNRKVLWLCRCDCGAESVVDGGNLRTGNTTSCGCYLQELLPDLGRQLPHNGRPKHGHAAGKRTPTYRSWKSMKYRCLDPNYRQFYLYGGRGIKVCDRWLGEDGFENFLADMGERPEGMTLDRIDPDGDYEPSNVRWADARTQRLNRRAS